jgi:peptidyl-prolyl cis-trans isomerase A (cyclophilin A)
MNPALRFALLFVAAVLLASCESVDRTHASSLLLHPDAPELIRRAPDRFDVRLQTSQGDMVIEVQRSWAPHGADRFYQLVRAGYYNGAHFFRVIRGRWAQFGINGNPAISKLWRERTIPDDPRVESNVRGTIAFAFAVPNGRATQVFINLRDNSATHDPEPFVPFGKVIVGMEAADALDAEYGESCGGGIRGGKQAPLFERGNAWLDHNFPRLDYIKRATLMHAVAQGAALEPPAQVAGAFGLALCCFSEPNPGRKLQYRTSTVPIPTS